MIIIEEINEQTWTKKFWKKQSQMTYENYFLYYDRYYILFSVFKFWRSVYEVITPKIVKNF